MIIIYSINKSKLKINIKKYMKKLTLHTLGEITQVEEIVGLGWSGKQISFHAAIDFNSCPYNWLYWLTHCLREVSKETIQNGLKQTKKKYIAREGEKNLWDFKYFYATRSRLRLMNNKERQFDQSKLEKIASNKSFANTKTQLWIK